VFQNEIVRDIWMYGRMKPPEISACTNETDGYICTYSGMKLPEISACAPEKNPTDIPARVPGMKPRGIPPGLKTGEVSVRVPVNKLKKKIEL
jgi:hypothetical protein